MINSKDIGLSEEVTNSELALSENITDNDPGLFKDKQTTTMGYLKT